MEDGEQRYNFFQVLLKKRKNRTETRSEAVKEENSDALKTYHFIEILNVKHFIPRK